MFVYSPFLFPVATATLCINSKTKIEKDYRDFTIDINVRARKDTEKDVIVDGITYQMRARRSFAEPFMCEGNHDNYREGLKVILIDRAHGRFKKFPNICSVKFTIYKCKNNEEKEDILASDTFYPVTGFRTKLGAKYFITWNTALNTGKINDKLRIHYEIKYVPKKQNTKEILKNEDK